MNPSISLLVLESRGQERWKGKGGGESWRLIASCSSRTYNNNGLEWKLVTNELSRPNTEPFPLPAVALLSS